MHSKTVLIAVILSYHGIHAFSTTNLSLKPTRHYAHLYHQPVHHSRYSRTSRPLTSILTASRTAANLKKYTPFPRLPRVDARNSVLGGIKEPKTSPEPNSAPKINNKASTTTGNSGQNEEIQIPASRKSPFFSAHAVVPAASTGSTFWDQNVNGGGLSSLVTIDRPVYNRFGPHILEEEIWYDSQGNIKFIRRKKHIHNKAGAATRGPDKNPLWRKYKTSRTQAVQKYNRELTVNNNRASVASKGPFGTPMMSMTKEQILGLSTNQIQRLTKDQLKQLAKLSSQSLNPEQLQELVKKDHRLQRSFNEMPPSPFKMEKRGPNEAMGLDRFNFGFQFFERSAPADKLPSLPEPTPAEPLIIASTTTTTITTTPMPKTTTLVPLPALPTANNASLLHKNVGIREDAHFLRNGLPKQLPVNKQILEKIQPIVELLESFEGRTLEEKIGPQVATAIADTNKNITDQFKILLKTKLRGSKPTKAHAHLVPLVEKHEGETAAKRNDSSDLPRLWVSRTSAHSDEYIKPVRACIDEHVHCLFWAKINECNRNPLFMTVYCCASCATRSPQLHHDPNFDWKSKKKA